MAEKDKDHIEEYADWKERLESDKEDPQEMFKQVCHIAMYMSYDLVDKIRWWEKETSQLGVEEVEKRLPHMAAFLDKLKVAYLEFADIEF